MIIYVSFLHLQDSEYFAMTTQGNIKVIQSPIKSRSVNLAIVVSDSAGHETTSVLEILIVHPHSVPPKGRNEIESESS